MVYVYPLSMAGLVLQLNPRASFQTEGLQIHRLQDILPFTSVSNLAERPVCRDVAEEGNMFRMIYRRWHRYAKDVYASYSSEEREWRNLHEGRLYRFRV